MSENTGVKTKEVAKEIEKLFIEKFGEKPSFAFCFMIPPDDEVHWITNVTREDGIKLFQTTAIKMIARTN